MREIATKKKLCLFKQTPIPAKVTFYIISRAFVSCLGCQHFISDWLGKLKPNKLSTGCQNELKWAAVEKVTNPSRRFLFFSRHCRSFSRASHANFTPSPLVRPALQNRHATLANYLWNRICMGKCLLCLLYPLLIVLVRILTTSVS